MGRLVVVHSDPEAARRANSGCGRREICPRRSPASSTRTPVLVHARFHSSCTTECGQSAGVRRSRKGAKTGSILGFRRREGHRGGASERPSWSALSSVPNGARGRGQEVSGASVHRSRIAGPEVRQEGSPETVRAEPALPCSRAIGPPIDGSGSRSAALPSARARARRGGPAGGREGARNAPVAGGTREPDEGRGRAEREGDAAPPGWSGRARRRAPERISAPPAVRPGSRRRRRGTGRPWRSASRSCRRRAAPSSGRVHRRSRRSRPASGA